MLKPKSRPVDLFQAFLLVLLTTLSSNVLAAQTEVNYTELTNWLCHPEHPNACDTPLDSTVVNADASTSVQSFIAATNTDIDCFYVYPTVSNDPTPNSDMNAGPEERRVIQAQFARFGSVCRTFAPLYRQITLTALRARSQGGMEGVDPAMAYQDVKSAWDHYLAEHNQGRGVVLVGHSQGSGVLTRLIKNEIDGKPIQSQLVSAMLIGSSRVKVPAGQVVGGTYKNIPLCESADQTQCVITFASFREAVPPPADSLFGKIDETGIPACTNPANLAGGVGELSAFLASGGETIASGELPQPWTKSNTKISTPFVQVPGLLSSECVNNGEFSYLAVKVNADPADPRTDQIAGDVMVNDQLLNAWGLHLIDVHLAMGNLVSLAQSQGTAYLDHQTQSDYLGAVGIGVKDLNAATRFYQEILGLEMLRTYELGYLNENVLGYKDGSGAVVVLMNWPKERHRKYNGNNVKLVFYVEDPGAVIDRIRQRGGKIDREATPHPALNGRLIGLGRDLDNYVVEVVGPEL